jgi:hypothetical protein
MIAAEAILKKEKALEEHLRQFFPENYKFYIYVDEIRVETVFFKVGLGGTEHLQVMVNRFNSKFEMFIDSNWIEITSVPLYKWFLNQMLEHEFKSVYDKETLEKITPEGVIEISRHISLGFQKQIEKK